jgi:hypothetical protein
MMGETKKKIGTKREHENKRMKGARWSQEECKRIARAK